jgi:diguanylate cyclase (GGDEF)-like protein
MRYARRIPNSKFLTNSKFRIPNSEFQHPPHSHTDRVRLCRNLSPAACGPVQARANWSGTGLDDILTVRLITRSDTSLTIALVAAAIILFRQPLRYVLDMVQDIEGRFRLDLLPALLLLVVVFTFHQYRKWTMARAEAVAAAADAAQARNQSLKLQQLMAFSRALANALDRPSLQQVLWRHLPGFAANRGFWVFIREGDKWELVVQDGTEPLPTVDELKQVAARALSHDGAANAQQPAGIEDACFPLVAGSNVVGVVGIAGTPLLAVEQRSLLDAAAAVMAIGVKNMQLFLDVRDLSLRDGLTGCFNRGYALDALDAELHRACRNRTPLSILMFDVDHFKSVNDRFGHLWGDDLLAAVGEQLGHSLRSTDIRCRYGGDEFLVILPETPALGAQKVADVVRQDLANLKVGNDANPMTVTVSIGVAAATSGELDAKAFIHRADEALYRAKSAGRNRLCVAVPPLFSDTTSGPRAIPHADMPRATPRSASFG